MIQNLDHNHVRPEKEKEKIEIDANLAAKTGEPIAQENKKKTKSSTIKKGKSKSTTYLRKKFQGDRELTPPRPPNSWILYRSTKFRELMMGRQGESNESATPSISSSLEASSTTIPSSCSVRRKGLQAEVSRVVSDMWKREPSIVKKQYSDLAEEKKRCHQEKFPDYKYRPKRHTPNTTTKATNIVKSNTCAVDIDFASIQSQKAEKKEAQLEKRKQKAADKKKKTTLKGKGVPIDAKEEALFRGIKSTADESISLTNVPVDSFFDLTASPTPEELTYLKESEDHIMQQMEEDDWTFALAAVKTSTDAPQEEEENREEEEAVELLDETEGGEEAARFRQGSDPIHYFSSSSLSESPWCPRSDLPTPSPRSIPNRPNTDSSLRVDGHHYSYMSSSGSSSPSVFAVPPIPLPWHYRDGSRGKNEQSIDSSPGSASSQINLQNSNRHEWRTETNLDTPSSFQPRMVVGDPIVTLSPLQLNDTYFPASTSAPPDFSLEGPSSSIADPDTTPRHQNPRHSQFQSLLGFQVQQQAASVWSDQPNEFIPQQPTQQHLQQQQNHLSHHHHDGQGTSLGTSFAFSSQSQRPSLRISTSELDVRLPSAPLKFNFHQYKSELQSQSQGQPQPQPQPHHHQHQHLHQPHSFTSTPPTVQALSITNPSNFSWQGAPLRSPISPFQTQIDTSSHSDLAPTSTGRSDYFGSSNRQDQSTFTDCSGVHLHEGFYTEEDLMRKLHELSQQDIDNAT